MDTNENPPSTTGLASGAAAELAGEGGALQIPDLVEKCSIKFAEIERLIESEGAHTTADVLGGKTLGEVKRIVSDSNTLFRVWVH